MALKFSGGAAPVSPAQPQSVAKVEPLPTPQSTKIQSAQSDSVPSESILQALMKKKAGDKRTLMLVKNATGMGYKVEQIFEAGQLVAVVQVTSGDKISFKTRITMREVVQYSPVWR